MIFRARFGAMAFLLARLSPSPRNRASPSELLGKAIKTDSLTIPTPGELFAAFEKPESPIGPVSIAHQFP